MDKKETNENDDDDIEKQMEDIKKTRIEIDKGVKEIKKNRKEVDKRIQKLTGINEDDDDDIDDYLKYENEEEFNNMLKNVEKDIKKESPDSEAEKRLVEELDKISTGEPIKEKKKKKKKKSKKIVEEEEDEDSSDDEEEYRKWKEEKR